MESEHPQGHLAYSAPMQAHESSDVQAGRLLLTGAVLAASILACAGLMVLLLLYFNSTRETPPPRQPTLQQISTAPKLLPHPPQELQDLRQLENEALTTYGWIDQQKAIARVPVERAMNIVLGGGLKIDDLFSTAAQNVLQPRTAETRF